MDENLKAREQMAAGTREFLQNQLQETKKVLETLEAKLKDFKLKHLGEMPEQQSANLQILGQLQSQLQLEGEALARLEQQKNTLQVLMPQSAPVVDLDEGKTSTPAGAPVMKAPVRESPLVGLRGRLATLQHRYGDQHPGIRKGKAQIADEDA